MKNLSNSEIEEIERIKNKKNRGFIQRNINLAKIINYLLLPIGSLISISTAYPSIYIRIFDFTNSFYISIIVSIIIGLFIEIAKWQYLPSFLDDIFDKTYKEGSATKNVLIAKGLVAVSVVLVSFYLSITGVQDIPLLSSPKTNGIVSNQNNDSRIADLKALISTEQKNINAAHKRTYAGKMTSDATALASQAGNNILHYQKELTDIETNIREALKRAEFSMVENKSISASKLTKVAGLGEIITVIFWLFLSLYESAAEKYIVLNNNVTPPSPLHPLGPGNPKRPKFNININDEIISTNKESTLNIHRKNNGNKVENVVLNDFKVVKVANGQYSLVSVGGELRTLDWVKQNLSSYKSKLRRGVDNPQTVNRRIKHLEAIKNAMAV